MQLQSLVGPEIATAAAVGPVDILGITADSRQVKPGWLFAAIPGAKADGTSFIPEAIAKGASAVLAKAGARRRRARRRGGAHAPRSPAGRWR